MAKRGSDPGDVTLKHLAAAIAEDQELSSRPDLHPDRHGHQI